jgi:hypothetical protein
MISYLNAKSAIDKINGFYKNYEYITNTVTIPTTIDLFPYVRILDCIQNKAFYRKLVTDDMKTTREPWDTKTLSLQISSGYILSLSTMEGLWLVILKEKIDDVHLLSGIIYKCYSAGLHNSKPLRTIEDSDKQVHWIWFRKSGYKLTNEIIERAASWIFINPSFTFHLWTNIKNNSEFEEFISELTLYNKDTFSKINVHFSDEFEKVIYDWMDSNTPDMLYTMKKIWNSTEKQDMIMKTDYTRNIILASKGGMYTDFNDCVCLSPIQPVLEAHAGSYLGITDRYDDSYASNYWLYAGRGNPKWNDIVKKCTNTLNDIYNLIYSCDAYELGKDTFEKMRQGIEPDGNAILSYLNFEKEQYKFKQYYGVKEFILVLTIALAAKSAAVNSFVIKNMFKHNKNKKYISEAIALFASLDKSIELNESDFRYGRVDIYSHSIMNCTNLPMFCREQNIDIDYLPFNYLFNSVTPFSFMGHIGDNTSFGREARNNFILREFIEKNTT